MTDPRIDIRNLGADCAATVELLFADYPYKKAQRRAQSLDPARLNRFYMANLRRALESGAPHWAAYRDGAPIAFAGLDADAWHAGIFELAMGKIVAWMDHNEPRAGAELLEPLLAEARARGFEHLSVRLDGEDYEALHLFESVGFRLIDVSLKFCRPMAAQGEVIAAGGGGWSIRQAREEDREWMRELGGRSHVTNHFLNDPLLAPEATRRLWEAWVDRCAGGLAYQIYVAEEGGGRPLGFVIYLQNERFAQALGRRPLILDFVILDPEARGGGLGPWLIGRSLASEAANGFDYCELRTSQHNHAALSCYEKLGFKICASDFLLHGTP